MSEKGCHRQHTLLQATVIENPPTRVEPLPTIARLNIRARTSGRNKEMSQTTQAQTGTEHAEKKKLHLVIVSLVGKWQHPFDPGDTVQSVIAQSLEHFKPKLEDGNYQLERKATKEIMDPNRTLKSYHLQDKEELLLIPTDDGGGQ